MISLYSYGFDKRAYLMEFLSLPESLESFQSMIEASLDSPFKTAALTILALCHYITKPEEALNMLSFLKGTKVLTMSERVYLSKELLLPYNNPFRFFIGATKSNKYKPPLPYTLIIRSSMISTEHNGKAFITIENYAEGISKSLFFIYNAQTNQWFLEELR